MIFKIYPSQDVKCLTIDVDTTNWRGVYQTDGIFHLVSEDCMVYKLNDINIDQFLKMENDKKLNMKVHGICINGMLTCNSCHGAGHTDWVTEITKLKASKASNGYSFFIPDSTLMEIKIFFHSKEHRFIFRPAKLHEGLKHCDRCVGSGLFSVKQAVSENEKLKPYI
jgi:hypothetical protein